MPQGQKDDRRSHDYTVTAGKCCLLVLQADIKLFVDKIFWLKDIRYAFLHSYQSVLHSAVAFAASA